MLPGQYIVQLSNSPEPQGRFQGWELRDTLLILIPGPTSLYAGLYRVPLEESTVAAQVLKTGTGGINIDACRVGTSEADRAEMLKMSQGFAGGSPNMVNYGYEASMPTKTVSIPHTAGRWPSNLLLVHHPECQELGVRRVKGGNDPRGKDGKIHQAGMYLGGMKAGHVSDHAGFSDTDGMETVANWQCHPECPVGLLDQQSGVLKSGGGNKNIGMARGQVAAQAPFSYRITSFKGGLGRGEGEGMGGDTGGASRFFPQFRNLPLALDWLARLIT